MRSGISVTLTPPDRRRLEAITKDRNAPQKHAWRAAIVLLTADGLGTNEVMRQTGTSKTCVADSDEAAPELLLAAPTDFSSWLSWLAHVARSKHASGAALRSSSNDAGDIVRLRFISGLVMPSAIRHADLPLEVAPHRLGPPIGAGDPGGGAGIDTAIQRLVAFSRGRRFTLSASPWTKTQSGEIGQVRDQVAEGAGRHGASDRVLRGRHQAFQCAVRSKVIGDHKAAHLPA